jgi:hypothetical protein
MCSPYVRKQANRLNWIIKGTLIDISWSDDDVEKTYNSYFKRVWGNNESYIHEEGFEEAYTERQEHLLIEEMKHVAVKGGHFD